MAADSNDKSDTAKYRDTLHLPRTDFPMRAKLPEREPQWLARWEQMKLHELERVAAAGRELFVLHDGPPYANGHLHIGHALNKILKDMVRRSQQLMGRDSRYVPGWDCHGLPIEWKVEEAFSAAGRAKNDVPVGELRAACREFADKWIAIQREEFIRLGVGGDWANPYTTMAFSAEAAIAAEFHKFVMNGSLYRGSKPVMWSTVEKTALAEAEIEYEERTSPTIAVRFPILSSDDSTLHGAALVIWTTTPWTIPSNRAIAFSPKLTYGVYRAVEAPADNWAKAGDRFVLADALAASTLADARVEKFEREGDASSLSEVICAHPLRGVAEAEGFWDYDVPALPGDFVTDESGTGLVHVAPSHGADDYELAVTHNLEITHNVDGDGRFVDTVPLFASRQIYNDKGKDAGANDAVMAALESAGALVSRGRLNHSYPHSWRSKAPLIFRNTPQWFIAIDVPLNDSQDADGTTIRARALKSIGERVRWVPETGRNRLRSMVEMRPDWVVSRQRAWGVPLACFVHRESGELLRDAEVNERIVEAFRQEGADAWFAADAAVRFLGAERDPADWEKIDDILDVWFESGSTHAFVLATQPDEQWPADLYLEGTDQHRGWFHSSLLQSCGTRGRAPYNAVLTHGFTLDENGEKMSKSRGNVIAPQDVIKDYGADILRIWIATSDYSQDLRIGPGILKSNADSYRRLRNTVRFMLGNLADWDPAERLPREQMPRLERWVLHRLHELEAVVLEGFENFAYQRVFTTLFNFCTNDLSSLYFDIRKDVLYCDSTTSITRRACRTVLDEVFRRVVTWLAPVVCFTAEEAWLSRFGDAPDTSVHLQTFEPVPAEWHDPALGQEMDRLRDVRRVATGALEAARQAQSVGSALETAPVVHVADPELLGMLNEAEFAEFCIVSAVTLTAGAGPADAFRLPEVEGVAVQVGRAPGNRCDRCWRVLPEVGQQATADLCARCMDVVQTLPGDRQ